MGGTENTSKTERQGLAYVSYQRGSSVEAVVMVGAYHMDLSTRDVLDLTRCLARLFPDVAVAEAKAVGS